MFLARVSFTNGSIFGIISHITTTICTTCLSSFKNTGEVKPVEKSSFMCKDQMESQWVAKGVQSSVR